MAHCNFLSDDDARLFAETGTAIGHCPISNAYFANSVIPIARFHAMGVDIGLGSDVSGGFSQVFLIMQDRLLCHREC